MFYLQKTGDFIPEELTTEQKKIVEQIYLDPATFQTTWPYIPFYPFWRTNNFIQRSQSFLFALDTTQEPNRWIPLEVDAEGRLEVASIAGSMTGHMQAYDGVAWRNVHCDGTGNLQVNIVSALPAGTNSIGNIGTVAQSNLYAFDGAEWQNLFVESAANKNLRVALYDAGVKLFPSPATLADASANPTTTTIASSLMVFNGTTWDRVRGDITNGLDVDVTRLPSTVIAGMTSLPAGNNNIGDVDVVSTVPVYMSETPINTSVSVGTTSTTVLSANPNRKYALLVNDSDTTIYIALSATATMNAGIRLNANGGAFELNATNMYTGPISAIHGATGTKNLCVVAG